MVTWDVTYWGAGMKQLGLSLVGAIKNFEQARRAKQQADAETLERLAKRAGDDAPGRRAFGDEPRAAAQARNGAVYHATACTKRRAVVRWIAKHSKRPMNASQLWAELFTAAHPSTGDILLTRAELAARLGLEPRTISELMTELAGINAITRRRAPGDLRDEPQCRYASPDQKPARPQGTLPARS